MTVLKLRHLLAFGAALACAAAANPAQAQATRTWVGSLGDDLNPCSRTQPCRTFAGAISKTAAGGEINCIDQGAYGAVTITKSVALVCEGVTAGVLHSATNGIVINAAATDNIFIRGLDINGSPPSAAGLNGIRFLNGASLTIENALIRGSTGAAPNGYGINFQPSGAARLVVTDTIIANNANGILIKPTGAGGSARASLNNVRVENNLGTGLRIDTTDNTSTTRTSVEIAASKVQGNATGVVAASPPSTSSIGVMMIDSSVSNNTGTGIVTNGAGVTMRVGGTTITGNAAGVLAAGGSTLATYGDNRLIGNPVSGPTSNGAFTGAAILTQ